LKTSFISISFVSVRWTASWTKLSSPEKPLVEALIVLLVMPPFNPPFEESLIIPPGRPNLAGELAENNAAAMMSRLAKVAQRETVLTDSFFVIATDGHCVIEHSFGMDSGWRGIFISPSNVNRLGQLRPRARLAITVT